MSKDLEVPKETGKDYVHTAIKTALGEVPLAGGALAEIFSAVIESPFQKRKIEWMHRVVDAIEELQEKGLKVDELRENEQFISAVFYASHLAMKTHQEDKLQALKNAIMNIAEGVETDEAIQQIYLNYIDQFTVLHIKILRFALSRTVPPNVMMGSLRPILVSTYPELDRKEGLVTQIWKELYNSGLISVDSLQGGLSSQGLGQKFTTQLGDNFLRFIEER